MENKNLYIDYNNDKYKELYLKTTGGRWFLAKRLQEYYRLKL